MFGLSRAVLRRSVVVLALGAAVAVPLMTPAPAQAYWYHGYHGYHGYRAYPVYGWRGYGWRGYGWHGYGWRPAGVFVAPAPYVYVRPPVVVAVP